MGQYKQARHIGTSWLREAKGPSESLGKFWEVAVGLGIAWI